MCRTECEIVSYRKVLGHIGCTNCDTNLLSTIFDEERVIQFVDVCCSFSWKHAPVMLRPRALIV